MKSFLSSLHLLRWFCLFGIIGVSSYVQGQSLVYITSGVAGTPAYNAGPIYRSSATSAYNGSRYTYLYTQAELAAVGIYPGSKITSLGWVKNNPAAANHPGMFKIYLKQSAATSFSLATETWVNLMAGATMVYHNPAFTVPATMNPNYIRFTLASPYSYTGGSLEVSTEFEMLGASSPYASDAYDWMWSSVPDAIYGLGLTNLSTTGNGTLSSTTNTISDITDRRPFIEIGFTSGAYNNAGLASISLPNYTCASSETLKVLLKNFGANAITTVNINWELDNIAQPTITYANTLDTVGHPTNRSDTLLTINSIALTPNVARTIKIWTSMPNGVADTATANDTLYFTIRRGLSGPYTIGGTSPDFATIGAAVHAMNTFGICGAVTFNINPASSPYTEQITLNQIAGTSATNTITFNGNGSTIQFAPTAADRHIIRLNGTDYVTFNNLRVVGTDATYGYGIHLMNGADYNTIQNCVVDLSAATSGTAANNAGIVSSNSTTANTTAGNNANYLTITNDTIIGGTSGVILNGTSATDPNTRNTVTNNVIRDFHISGVDIFNLDSTTIANNDIHRMNRTTVGSFYGVSLRAGNRRSLISKNKIHGTHNSATTLTGLAYGIELVSCDAPVDSENVIVNNIIYDFNSASGTIYGLYNSGSDGAKFYHNTVVLDYAAATAGTTRGFYQTTAASNIHIRNNIFHITRGGTGAKNCLYFNTNTSTITSNNNVLYLNAAAGTNGIGYWGTNMVTLVDWKAANGGAFDQQSRANNPLFTSMVPPLNYTPTEIGINDLGANVGVTTDFTGALRTATPDPGAYEFTPTATLDGVLSWVSPVDLVAAGNRTISVNVGNNLTTTITSVEIAYTDGINPPVSETFSSLSISAGNSQQLSFATQYNFTVPVSLRAYIKSVNGVADATQGNDTTSLRSICIAFPTGTYTINSAVPTGGGNYQTFTAAIAAVASCGVVGPIVFNVDPASGPYRERITIPEIKGASATNTITINGNNRRLFDSSLTATRAIITLNGADYITIDSLEIVSISPTFGWGIHLTNGADNNMITNCTIDMTAVTSTTESNSACIVGSGSTTSVLTDGNANRNLIDRNTLIGAYKGLILNGATGALFSVKNIVTNNIIKDFYQNGMEFTDNDSLLVQRNDISRANRVAVTTMSGVELGAGNQNCVINANRIHDTHNSATTQSGAAYGIFSTANDAPVGAHNIVSNNVIYNFNSTTGTQYGLYNSSSNGVYYFYNTISFDYQGSTSGTTRGVYQTTLATDIQLRNNIITVSRSGSGAKNCIYLNTATSIVASNNNILNMASTTGTVGVGFFDATNYPTLANWKTANGGIYDAQSISADPLFNGPTNFRLLNGSPAVGAGAPIAAVPNDYTGSARSATTPTIGAFEIAGDFIGPEITITQLSNTSSTANRTIGGNISITDANGIDTVNHKARIYYKKTTDNNVYAGNTSASNGWKWTAATTNTPPYNFVVNYSLLNGGSVSVTDTIQYFIVAQDLTPSHNVGTGSAVLNADVDSVELTSVHFPVKGTLSTYRIVSPISGTYQVGASSTPFHNLSEVAAALRSTEVTGNTVFELMSDYNGSTGEVFPIVFDQISISSAAFTIKFVPHSSVSTTLVTTGYPESGVPLITIDGGDQMIFDGRPGGIGDSTNIKWVLRNKRSAATFSPTVLLINGATNNTFTYLDIQSGNTLATSGTFMFGTSTGATGNSFNTVSNNYIRNRTDSIGIHANAIYAAGSSVASNSNNSIDSNRISNYTTSGISIVATGNGDSWNIRRNHLYYDLTPAPTTAQTSINFAAISNNNTIAHNAIGGSTIGAGGSVWLHTGTTAISGITAAFGSGGASSISNNIVKNIERTNTGAGVFSGITVTAGNANIRHNMIGDTLTPNSILLTGTSAVTGISNTNNSLNTLVNIENNWVSNIRLTNAATGAIVRGISYTSGTPYPPCNIRNNKVFNLSTNSAQTGYAGGSIAGQGIYVFPGGYSYDSTSEISGNMIYDITATNTTAATNVSGVTLTNFWGTFHHNKIYGIRNFSAVATPIPATANGIFARFLNGNSTIHNNMVSLTSTPSDSVQMNGIMVAGGTAASFGGAHVYVYNSINVSNANGGLPVSTYAFHRGENDNSLQSYQPIVMKNNIFVNTVTSAGSHYAVGDQGVAPGSNWIGAQNNHNDFYGNAANQTLWGTTPANLASWKTLSSGDANSVAEAVFFVNPIVADLHLTGTSLGNLNLAAAPVNNFTVDFDGETRDFAKPYMGADENILFPLPVALVRFTASQANNDVVLHWATATESNSSHFEIERSVDGKNFETVSKVKAKGTSVSIVNYRQDDKSAFKIAGSNTLYYRLRMVDNDGKFEYSKLAIVSLKETKESTPLTVFPNPFNDHTYVTISAEQQANAVVSVIDITGKVVINYTESVVEGVSTLELQQTEGLKSGIYFVSVEVNGVKQVAKLLKQ